MGVVFSGCLDEEGDIGEADHSLPGEGLHGIEHPATRQGYHIHGYAACGMHDQRLGGEGGIVERGEG